MHLHLVFEAEFLVYILLLLLLQNVFRWVLVLCEKNNTKEDRPFKVCTGLNGLTST